MSAAFDSVRSVEPVLGTHRETVATVALLLAKVASQLGLERGALEQLERLK